MPRRNHHVPSRRARRKRARSREVTIAAHKSRQPTRRTMAREARKLAAKNPDRVFVRRST